MHGLRRAYDASEAPAHRESVSTMTSRQRQRIAWFAWTIVLVSSLVAVRVLNSQATASARESDRRCAADARFGFRLRGVREGARRGLRPPGADVRRAARAHHAAGGVDGRGGGRRRLRPRRLAGLLRHQQRRGQPEPAVSQQGRRHVRGRRRADGRRRREPARHRRVDGRGLGRLRQRRLRGSVPLQVRPPGAVSQRSGQALRRGRRARRACRAG